MSGIVDVLGNFGYTFNGTGRYLRCNEFDSLVVNVDNDLYYWNSKNKGGNVYQFLTDIEGKSPKEAMGLLDNNLTYSTTKKKPKRNITLPDKTRIEYLTQRANYYHRLLMEDDEKIEYWLGQGINTYSIKLFNLGWAYECPVVPYIDSFTIPYIRGSDIINIRHRLNVSNKDKYRPEMSGLNNYLFNVNGLYRQDGISWPGDAILLEGEKKAIVFNQYGFRAASIPGANTWRDDFINHFDKANIDFIYVLLDPGMEEQAEKLAYKIKKYGKQSKAIFLPEKPDDFLNNGNSVKDVMYFMYK